MSTYAHAEAWCTVEETGARLLVRWGGEGFDKVRSDFRRSFPRHGDAVYSPEDRAWSVPTRHRARLASWVALWFEPEATAWEPEQPPAARASRPDAALLEAYQTLCVTPQAPMELVSAARRILGKIAHPDHTGGDELAMRRLNHAHDLIAVAREPGARRRAP